MESRCRCCLTTNSITFNDIFQRHKSGTTWAEFISFFAEVQINQDDGLSQQICIACKDEMIRIHEFSLKVRHADAVLRKELDTMKPQIEQGNIIGNIQMLEHEYFAPVEDHGMQVCVVEEIVEHENEQGVLMVEEIHEGEEINIIDEISASEKNQEVRSFNRRDSLLEGLALVAATQKNVNIDNQNEENFKFLPEDENDDEYMIEFDQNQADNVKLQKWKCGECKLILRGDVSYEGHMNLHKQIRPHLCHLCRNKYRCRTALKRHNDLKHSFSTPQNLVNENTLLCHICQNGFQSEIIFRLHQSIVHNQSGSCPFDCGEPIENLKQHLNDDHEQEVMCAAEIPNNSIEMPMYQCFKCSETFRKQCMFENHVKLCQIITEDRFEDDDIMNENIVEIVKIEESELSLKSVVYQKSILQRNQNTHMDMYKRKEEEEINSVENAQSYQCSFCQNTSTLQKTTYSMKDREEQINHGILAALKELVKGQRDVKRRLERVEQNQQNILHNQCMLSNGQVTLVTHQERIADTLERSGSCSVSKAELMAQTNLLMESKISIKKVEESVCSITGETSDKNLDEVTAMLPLRTIEAVQEMELKLQSPDFAYAVRTYVCKCKGLSDDVSSVLRSLFTDDLLNNYNWDGRWEKHSLAKLELCNKILRELFPQLGCVEFLKNIRKAIDKSHHRLKQKMYLNKKQSN